MVNFRKYPGRTPYTGDGDELFDDTADAIKTLPTRPDGTTGGNVGTIKEVRVTTAIDTSDDGAFAANDVVGNDDCCTTTATFITFSEVVRANGEYGYITSALIVSESESVTPQLTLFLFNAGPTSELRSNFANTAPDSADLAKYIGKIDFPALESLGTTDSHSLASPSTVGNLPLAFKCASGSDDLFGILVTRSIFTQTDTDDMTIVLLIEQY